MSVTSPRGRTLERISLRELNEVYGCPTRRDAMKLALDQSNGLSAASSRLVELLFEYFKDNHGYGANINSTRLVRTLSFGETETGNLNSNSNSNASHRKMGLSLPASAIGWLSCYLLPDESDIQYQKLWEDVPLELCLPHASPTPQVQNKLSLLKILLQSHVTHLRVTNIPWPADASVDTAAGGGSGVASNGGSLQKFNRRKVPRRQSNNLQEYSRRRGRMLLNFDTDSVSSFLRFYRLLQQQPRIDMRLFPQAQYLSFHGIAVDWIHNLSFPSDHLVRLSIQRCYVGRNNDGTVVGELHHIFLGGSGDGKSDTTNTDYEDDYDGMSRDNLGISGSNMTIYNMLRLEMGQVTLQGYKKYSSLQHLILSHCGIGDCCLIPTPISYTNPEVGGERYNGETSMGVGISFFDLFPELITIDLSHNQLVNMENILRGMNCCPCLRVVDMSHNRIRSMVGTDICIGNIKVLLLSNNYINNVNGLDRLYSLERLSLENNLLANLSDLSKLAKLPNLEELSLQGNPIAYQANKKYRIQVLNLFKELRLQGNDSNITFRNILQLLPTLDGIRASRRELKLLKYLSFGQRIPKADTTVILQDREIFHDIEDQCYQMESGSNVNFAPKPKKLSLITRNTSRMVAVIGSLNEIHESKRQNVDDSLRDYKGQKTFATIENVIRSIDMSGAIERNTAIKSDSNSHDTSVCSPSIDHEDRRESINRCLSSSTQSPDDDDHIKEFSPPKISPPLIIHSENEQDVTSDNDNMAHDDSTKKSEDDKSKQQCDEYVIKDQQESRSDLIVAKNVDQNELDSSMFTVDGLTHSVGTEIETNQTRGRDKSMQQRVVKHQQESRTDIIITKDVDQNELDSSLLIVDELSHSTETEIKANQTIDPHLSPIDFAAMERDDTYDGPRSYSNLCIAEYCELYFRCFVFPTVQLDESVDLCEEMSNELKIPKIQLYQIDRELMMAFSTKKETNDISTFLHNSNTEHVISVSKESIIPCGIAATARIQPKSKEVKNAKGSIICANSVPYRISECQKLLMCISNKAIYFIPDFSETTAEYRSFPSPIGVDSTFSSGYWPHAYCRHPLKYLRKISFDGYGFQRLTLFFKLPSMRCAIYAENGIGDMSAYDYTYVICTYSQRDTIKLLQTLQQAVKDARPDTKSEAMPSSLAIENENISTVKAIGRALARTNFSDDILHYQIVYQTWNTNISLPSDRRSFVLTNNEVFLFNETYGGDLSSCADDEKFPFASYGDIHLRTIASACIEEILNVCISKDDAMVVIITFGSKSKMRWSSYSWHLKCISLENAELLINDIRNAVSF
mmetsp:Transcript_12415/g.23283  ORF Transcript_12415/g.23283 Transcript_12415/m.23283 type:complete len:1309 (+) Transcript_12415:171-4097(+)